MRTIIISLLFSLLISLSQEETLDFNPYEVLEVSNSASNSDIRKSYKRLAKEWHPDKNKSPNAQDKFIKIQQAYEILSSEDKRQQYDTGGYSGDTVGQWQHQSSNGFHFSFSDFNHDYFNAQGSSHAVSTHDYHTRVLPASHLTPQVLYVYSTFCGQCIIWLKTSWKKASTQLEKLGVDIGEVDMTFASHIARSLSVRKVPTIVGIYKEKVYYFHGQISYEELKFFVKSFLPNNFVSEVTSASASKFLSDFTVDDKPRAVLFSSKSTPTLLYTLLAVKYQHYIKFGFVNLNNRKSEKFARNFSVSSGGPTLLIFKEDLYKPSVVLGASEMPHGAVNDILDANKYVVIPRLLSGRVFDEICPSPYGAMYNVVKVCAVLISDPEYDDYDIVLNNLRTLVRKAEITDSNMNEWLKFMHVRASKQPGFARSLASKDVSQTQLFILWRRGQSSASVSSYAVDFLRQPYKEATQEFQIFLRTALEAAHLQKFHKTVSFIPLTDELQPMFLLYGLRLIIETIEGAYNFVYSIDSRTFMMITSLTVVCVLSFLSYFTGDDNETQNTARNEKGGTKQPAKKQDIPKPKDELVEKKYPFLNELLPSNYESLILCQARGHMTAVLLADKQTELDHGVQEKFARTMKIHSIKPIITMTYLDIEQYASWYLELRNSSTAEPPHSAAEPHSSEDTSTLHGDTEYDHNPSIGRQSDFVSGTVLVINGSKHWYCLFVPRGVKWDMDEGDQGTPLSPQPDESHIQSYEEALSNWMDKLIGGQMPRLYVRQWPGLYLHPFESQEDMEEDDF